MNYNEPRDELHNNLSLATAITRSRYSSHILVYVTQRKSRSRDGKECAPIVFRDSRVQTGCNNVAPACSRKCTNQRGGANYLLKYPKDATCPAI